MTLQRLATPEIDRPDPESNDADVFPYTGDRTGTDLRSALSTPADCPDCGASPVLVQGLADCPDCEWNGR